MLELNHWFFLGIPLMVAFSLADRIAGGGILGKSDRPFSSDIAAGCLLLAVIAIINYLAGLFVAAWIIWRAPAWKLFGYGGNTPRTLIDGLAVYARNLFIAPIVPFCALAGLNWRLAALGAAAWALFSTFLALLLASKGEDEVALMEHIRGLAFGLYTTSIIWVSFHG